VRARPELQDVGWAFAGDDGLAGALDDVMRTGCSHGFGESAANRELGDG
jgi:hypothetical protein